MNRPLPSVLLWLLLTSCADGHDSARNASPDTPAASVTSEGSLFDLPSTFHDQAGRVRHLSDLAGQVSVVTMVYTSCTVTCPLVVADLQRVDASLRDDEQMQVRFVLVSLDPARDQPARLAEWAADRGLDSARWMVLVGSDDAVRSLSTIIGMRYQQQSDGEIAHTNVFNVVGRDGVIASQVQGTGQASELQRQIRRVLAGSSQKPTVQPH